MNRENVELTARITASDTQELYDLAKSKGIMLPHPSLGIFKSVLAEIEKPNANGIRLGKDATLNAVDTLIGTQINRNHLRAGNVLGHIIDSSINGGDIEVVCIFFKDIYQDEYAEAMDLFKENELTMSFELSADVQSQDKLQDGTKRLNDYYFTGAGLLFGVAPACKKARVYEMATKNLYNQLNVERQSLIFANSQKTKKSIMDILSQMTQKAEEITAEEVEAQEPVQTKGETIMNEEQKNLILALRTELGDYLPKETKDEDLLVEAKVAEFRKLKTDAELKAKEEADKKVADEAAKAAAPVAEAKIEVPVEEAKAETPVAEIKAEVPVVEVKAETKVEEVKAETSTTVREETVKVTDTVNPDANTETVTVETTTKVSQDGKPVAENTSVSTTVYTYAQVEAIKSEYEAKLTAKDAEIVTIKATAEKLATRKLELKANEFTKDFTDADYLDDTKVENATLKATAAKKETVVAEKEEVVVLSTGHKKFDASEEILSPVAKMLKNKRNNKK